MDDETPRPVDPSSARGMACKLVRLTLAGIRGEMDGDEIDSVSNEAFSEYVDAPDDSDPQRIQDATARLFALTAHLAHVAAELLQEQDDPDGWLFDYELSKLRVN